MSALEIGLKHLMNASQTVQGLIGADIETKLQQAVIDIQSEIISAQQSNITAQTEHADLLNRVRALEAEIVQMKDWTEEAARYELKAVSPQGVVVYALKESEQGSEPPHELCPNCFANGKKSIMQPTPEIAPRVRLRQHRCPACQTMLAYSPAVRGGTNDNPPTQQPEVRRDPPPIGRRR